MSLVREYKYDEVFDAQEHFRQLLDAMARPGKINTLEAIEIEPPFGLRKSTAYICFALLNRDVGFYFTRGSTQIESYLRINTGSVHTELQRADFIIATGMEPPELLEFVKEGTLAYPETGASILVEIDYASETETADALGLRLSGPGVKGKRDLWVSGWQEDWVQSLMEKNSEFPIGIDTFLSFTGEANEASVCCLPRTTRIEVI